jgi:hypothetical protein
MGRLSQLSKVENQGLFVLLLGLESSGIMTTSPNLILCLDRDLALMLFRSSVMREGLNMTGAFPSSYLG